MRADDVFRREFAETIGTLKAWARPFVEDGMAEIQEGPTYFSIIARPATPGTCAATLVLRADQKYDLSLGNERFEDRPIEDFKLFPAMLSAVAQGHVERKHLRCAVTGADRGLETRVELGDGRVWREQRGGSAGRDHDSLIEETTRFLPYRR